MDKATKPKGSKNYAKSNLLESLKDIGSTTVKSLKDEVLKPEVFIEQIFGKSLASKKFSGEITPGESIEIKEVFSGKHEENLKLRHQLSLERQLREEEKAMLRQRENDLKIQLHAVMEEMTVLAKNTATLSEEVKIAAVQSPIEPGVYHLIFFEKLLEFIKSFQKKIEDAAVWLHATNTRALKKNYWSNYKKHGSKFLLSPDHYLSRSAG